MRRVLRGTRRDGAWRGLARRGTAGRGLALVAAGALLLGGVSPAFADSGGHVVVPGNAQTRLDPPRHTILVETNRTPQRITVFAWSALRSKYTVRHHYRVASGLPAFPTPRGVFAVAVKVAHPVWIAPFSPWVPVKERGKRFGPDNPQNPLVGAWLGLSGTDGIGLHGTRETSTLGGQASHGCLRMTEAGVLSLYRIVEVGTPVTIR